MMGNSAADPQNLSPKSSVISNTAGRSVDQCNPNVKPKAPDSFLE